MGGSLKWRGRAALVVGRVRSPDSGVIGQGIRFALAGSVVTCVYVLLTLGLSDVAGVAFQVALVVGFTVALMTHFTLQRFFVWAHHEEFALPVHAQVGRYLAVALAQYAVTAGLTSSLPGLLRVPTEAVYLAVAALITATNFFVFRTRVFHTDGQKSPADRRG